MIINESVSGFRTDKTGTSYYDNFLNPKDLDYMRLAKGLDGKVEYYDPDWYIEDCARKIFHCSVERVLRGLNKDTIHQYANMMKSGTKFNLPYLNFAQETQEGRHRALAAKEAGIQLMPVLIVTNYDAKKELGLVGTMDLWYGHTLTYTDKSGKKHDVHVGMDVKKMKDTVNKIKRSGDYI